MVCNSMSECSLAIIYNAKKLIVFHFHLPLLIKFWHARKRLIAQGMLYNEERRVKKLLAQSSEKRVKYYTNFSI